MPELHGDAEWALHQIIDIACTRKLEWVVAAGDLIDKRVNDSPPIDSLARQLQRLRDCGVEFGYVQGQHEMADPPWVQTVSCWSHHLHGKSTKVGPFLTYGLDYRRTQDIGDAFAQVPKGTDIVIAHQVWEEFMGSRAQASLAVIPHAAKCITGDFHRFEMKSIRGKTGQKLTIISPGATHMRKIDEPDAHYVVIWNGEKFTKLKLRSRPVVRQEIVTERDLVDFCRGAKAGFEALADANKDLPAHIRKPIIRVRYPVVLPDAKNRIAEAIGNTAFLFEDQVWPETETQQVSRKKRDELVKLGLEGCLELLVEDKGSALYLDTMSLLAASRDNQEILDVIDSIKKRYLNVAETAGTQ